MASREERSRSPPGALALPMRAPLSFNPAFRGRPPICSRRPSAPKALGAKPRLMGANAQLLDTCLANKNIIGANNIFCLRLRVAERAEGARGGAMLLLDTCLAKKNIIGANNIFCLATLRSWDRWGTGDSRPRKRMPNRQRPLRAKLTARIRAARLQLYCTCQPQKLPAASREGSRRHGRPGTRRVGKIDETEKLIKFCQEHAQHLSSWRDWASAGTTFLQVRKGI